LRCVKKSVLEKPLRTAARRNCFTSEDASQKLLIIEYQHRACAALPPVPAGFLHRLALCPCDQLLAFDDIRELSVGS
jgi:hypothetical protein